MHLGKYNIKTPHYHQKQWKDTQRRDETICKIKKSNLKHWLVEGLETTEIMIPQRNEWFQHLVTFPNKDKEYIIIADNP